MELPNIVNKRQVFHKRNNPFELNETQIDDFNKQYLVSQ